MKVSRMVFNDDFKKLLVEVSRQDWERVYKALLPEERFTPRDDLAGMLGDTGLEPAIALVSVVFSIEKMELPDMSQTKCRCGRKATGFIHASPLCPRHVILQVRYDAVYDAFVKEFGYEQDWDKDPAAGKKEEGK